MRKLQTIISLLLTAVLLVSGCPVWADETDMKPVEEAVVHDTETITQETNVEETTAPTSVGLDSMTLPDLAPAVSKALAANDERQAKYDKLAAWTDPNYISDEVFYGKYNRATDTWTNPGYFDYERIPELKEVQEAAKDDNYELAKELCLEYYRERMATYNTGVLGGTAKKDILTMELMEQNMHWNENSNITLLNTFTVGNEAQTVNIDLIEDISTITSSSDQLFTVYLMALKKDGSSAEFDSINKVGGATPTLEITINGVTNKLTATDDAYVSPAANRNTNYGTADTINVEESTTSINTTLPVDANTKRGYIKFDLSSIPKSASITSATLKLYGKNAANTGDMKLVAFRVSTNSWTESAIKYYTFEHAIFSWYGEDSFRFISSSSILQDNGTNFCSSRFPEELLRFGTWMLHSVGLYTQSKEDNEHYAYIGLNQWAGFIKQRGSNPGYDKNLDVSVRSVDMPRFLRYLIMSEHMTPELWSATVKLMWGSGNSMYNTAHQNNNWRTFEVRGFNAINSYFNEFADHYKWVEKLRYYAQTNIDVMVYSDGTNAEAAMGYGIYALADMIDFGSANIETGLTAAEHIPYNAQDIAKVEKGYLFMAKILGPEYCDNQTGDGGAYTAKHKARLLAGGEFFNNQYLLYIGSDGKRGNKTDNETSVFYDGGYELAMRTGWEKNDLYLYTDASGGKKSHNHYDDNNIILFANGKYLLTDQLFYTYTTSDAIYKKLVSTEMHNTVWVDGTNQALPSSKSNSAANNWATNNAYDISNLLTKNSSGANHYRNIVFVKPNFWIVSDYLTPKTAGSHSYRQHWHMLPTAKATYDETTGVARSHYVGEANIVIAQGNMDGVNVSLQDGKYSSGTNSVTDTKYLRYEQVSDGYVKFDTLLIPEKAGEEIEVSTSAIQLDNVQNNGATAMDFEIDNHTDNSATYGSYYLVHDSAQKATRAFGDYKTDASFAYVEKNKKSNLSRILLQNGMLVEDTAKGTTLVKSTVSLPDVGIEYGSNVVTISSDSDIDLTKLTVSAGAQKVSIVKWNGESISFQRAGSYLYFGEEPILDDSDTAPETDEKETNNTPSSHGSKGSGGGVMAPTPTPTPTPATNESFSDLSDTAWAKEYIDELADAKIISGNGSGKFHPKQNVTREEFVKMISLVAGLKPIQDAELPMKDVDKSHWSYPYIAAAYQAGIITGVSEDSFGLGSQIKRQDMAVIVHRVLQKLGVVMDEKETQNFADSNAISSYAMDSVNKMQRYGLLSGDDAGNFNPQNTTTRAESAKVLCMILRQFILILN